MTSLQELRDQIDVIDRKLIASLGDKATFLNPAQLTSDLTENEIKSLLSTGLYFTALTWKFLEERLEIVKEVGNIKHQLGITEFVDEARRKQVFESRREWASEHQGRQVQELYELIHTISLRLQREIIEK